MYVTKVRYIREDYEDMVDRNRLALRLLCCGKHFNGSLVPVLDRCFLSGAFILLKESVRDEDFSALWREQNVS